MSDDIKQKIEAANAEAVQRMIDGDPVLVDIAPAGEVIPGLGDRMVLHSGPPVEWARMSGAQRGAVIGMLLFEGWSSSPEQAQAMLDAGEIGLDANHEHQAVGPMAGTISPSLPVYVVEDRAHGTRAYCRNVEGMQQFGAYRDEAIEILRAWRDIHAPAFSAALRHSGPLELCYFNPYTALGLSMAAAKAMADSLRDLEYSTVVRVMARNGTDWGIKVAGLGDQWFVAPAPLAAGKY